MNVSFKIGYSELFRLQSFFKLKLKKSLSLKCVKSVLKNKNQTFIIYSDHSRKIYEKFKLIYHFCKQTKNESQQIWYQKYFYASEKSELKKFLHKKSLKRNKTTRFFMCFFRKKSPKKVSNFSRIACTARKTKSHYVRNL